MKNTEKIQLKAGALFPDAEQILFWDEPLGNDNLLILQVIELKEKQNNLRRGLFQRYDNIQKEIADLKEQVATLKCLLGIKEQKPLFKID